MKLVIQNMSAVWGGNEKWLSIVARGLGDRGHDVVVSCRHGPVRDGLNAAGIRVTRHRPRGMIDIASALDFAGWLRIERPDALLLTSWHSIAWSGVAAHLAGLTRVVMRLGIVRPFPRKGLRSLALTRYVDALIVNSDEIRREWLETQPDDAHAGVHVVLNAIRSTRSERDANRATLRKELGVSDDILLIGGAGHLSARKGFDILLHGFRDARLADALLVIVGDGDNLKELQSLAQSLGVSGSVRWLGHRENGAELVSGLDVFVLSSHNEGMANVMLEAMAGGAPVIAADISGVAKAIGATDSRPAAGWMYEPGNASRLAATMREVAGLTRGRSPLVTERAEEAHWRIEHWFSPARMIDECEAILFPR